MIRYKRLRRVSKSGVHTAIMGNADAPPAARVSAANAILDRGWGKPAQAITGPEGKGPQEIVVRWQSTESAASQTC